MCKMIIERKYYNIDYSVILLADDNSLFMTGFYVIIKKNQL